jgi:glycosyltransferase involved in cell wall biosynthesis
MRSEQERRGLLHSDTVQILPVRRRPIRATDVPDADVVVATWWTTRRWIESWPRSKGIKAHFIRHYETHGGDPEQVKAVYRMDGVKLVIASWLYRIMVDEFHAPDVTLVPNGVDWNQFGAPPRGKQDRPTVGLMYSEKPIKDIDKGIRALELLGARVPNLRVLSFGAYPFNGAISGVSDVRYHRKPPMDELASIYASADCWLGCSRTEGFYMPGLEAAACRCPVVSTRCGGPEDYIDDGRSGFLVPVGDSGAMADAVQRVLELPDAEWRAMSERSYQMAQRFNWDESAAKMEAALLAALERSGSPAVRRAD